MSALREILAGDELVSGAAMAAMALGSVGLWTLRVAFAARGRKVLGAAVAALEAVVFAVAFSNLASSLDAPMRVIGYAVGVAGGTLLGLFLDERSSHGKSEIQMVVHGEDPRLTTALRRLGWPATSFIAQGPNGPVTVGFLAVDDGEVAQVVDVLRRTAPDAFWAVQQLRRMHPSLPGQGSAPILPLGPPPAPRRPHRSTNPNPTLARETSHEQQPSFPTATQDHAA